AEGAGLRDYHQLGAGHPGRADVLGEMPVVADAHPNPPDSRRVDRRSSIAGVIVGALVKPGVVGNVDHPGDAEQRAVGVQDGGTVKVTSRAVALVHVEHRHQRMRPRPLRDGWAQWAWNRLGKPASLLV